MLAVSASVKTYKIYNILEFVYKIQNLLQNNGGLPVDFPSRIDAVPHFEPIPTPNKRNLHLESIYTVQVLTDVLISNEYPLPVSLDRTCQDFASNFCQSKQMNKKQKTKFRNEKFTSTLYYYWAYEPFLMPPRSLTSDILHGKQKQNHLYPKVQRFDSPKT